MSDFIKYALAISGGALAGGLIGLENTVGLLLAVGAVAVGWRTARARFSKTRN